MFIASYATQNDVVFFTTLEGIDTGHLDLLVQILLECTVVLHVIDDIRPLTFVWCDDTDLARDDSSLEEFGHNLFDIRGLGSTNSESR